MVRTVPPRDGPFRVWFDLRFSEAGLQTLRAGGAEPFGPARAPAQPDPFVGIEDADGAIVSSVLPWDDAAYRRAGRLRALGRNGIGVDNVDIAAATHYGVMVLNAPDAPTESTAEFTITLMLALVRKVRLADRRVRANQWGRDASLFGMELLGKTLGLVGLGRIGGRVAEIARALGMRVVAYDPYTTDARCATLGVTRAATLADVLAQADVVSLHTPVTPETRDLLNDATFALMKRGAYLVNCGRGALIDDAALLRAIRSGQVAGAALDVMRPEPPPPDHPLFQLDEVLLAPHIAPYTADGVAKAEQAAIQQMLDALHGRRPTYLVNPEVWPNG